MKCGNSIVLHEQIRKVFVNGRLDHEVSDGIGICAFDMKGGVRVISSWPKREKVLKINGMEVVFIGRTAEGYPIVWMLKSPMDAMSIAGSVSVRISSIYKYKATSHDDWVETRETLELNGPVSEGKITSTIAPVGPTVTLPDAHKGVDSAIIQDGNIVVEVYLSGLWDYNYTLEGSDGSSSKSGTGYSSACKVARLSVSTQPGPIEAKATAYGSYPGTDYVIGWTERHERTTVGGVTCSIEDCEED